MTFARAAFVWSEIVRSVRLGFAGNYKLAVSAVACPALAAIAFVSCLVRGDLYGALGYPFVFLAMGIVPVAFLWFATRDARAESDRTSA